MTCAYTAAQILEYLEDYYPDTLEEIIEMISREKEE